MDDRQAFITLIEQHPHDYSHRYIYADWLDEHGEHEEADRQRKYEQADKDIDEVVEALQRRSIERDQEWRERYPEDYADEPDYVPEIDRETFMEMATGAFSKDHWSRKYMQVGTMSFGNLENEMYDFIESDMAEKFWKAWAVVTGMPYPEEEVAYRCAC